MEEIWKDVIGYEGLYQVSNLGNVKSLPKEWFSGNNKQIKKKHDGMLLKKIKTVNGYLSVSLLNNGSKKQHRIHQLVCMAFFNHKPDGTHKIVCDHKNDDKTDNRLENLQLISQRENAFKTQGNYSSKYKGVCWHKKDRKWYSRIHINGKNINLGSFDCELKAHLVYQNKLKTL
jgi:hypothetical protein